MNLYGIVFRASREIGQAMILSGLAEKDGSANCKSAAKFLRDTKETVYVNEAAQLDRIANNWRGLLGELGPTWIRIQNAFGNPSAQYHSASSGYLMGMATAGLANVGKGSSLPWVKKEVESYLEGAKAHTRAIKDQGFKKDMKIFDSDFGNVIGGIQSIGDVTANPLGECRNALGLVNSLSDNVANAL